jgi:hypothetical protein
MRHQQRWRALQAQARSYRGPDDAQRDFCGDHDEPLDALMGLLPAGRVIFGDVALVYTCVTMRGPSSRDSTTSPVCRMLGLMCRSDADVSGSLSEPRRGAPLRRHTR